MLNSFVNNIKKINKIYPRYDSNVHDITSFKLKLKLSTYSSTWIYRAKAI